MRLITFVCDICNQAIPQGSVLFSFAMGVGTEQIELHGCGKRCATEILKRGIGMLENWDFLTDKTQIVKDQ